MSKIAVFFHYPCNDGLAAAAVFRASHSERALEFFPANYDAASIDRMTQTLKENVFSLVYFADYTPPECVILESNCDVIILDHHKTGKEHFDSYSDAAKEKVVSFIFDTEKCGATLAFDFFEERLSFYYDTVFKSPYTFLKENIELINIRDTWLQPPVVTEEEKLRSDALSANLIAVSSGKLIGVAVNNAYILLVNELKLEPYINSILERRSRCKNYAKVALIIPAKKFLHEVFSDVEENIALVNVALDHCGETAQEIYENESLNCPYVATYCIAHEDGTTQLRLSFRSRKGFPIRKAAEYFGGGGHDHAAGARVTDKSKIEAFLFGQVYLTGS